MALPLLGAAVPSAMFFFVAALLLLCCLWSSLVTYASPCGYPLPLVRQLVRASPPTALPLLVPPLLYVLSFQVVVQPPTVLGPRFVGAPLHVVLLLTSGMLCIGLPF